jgi:glycosyltransferase involved in cell wall biosynthesis
LKLVATALADSGIETTILTVDREVDRDFDQASVINDFERVDAGPSISSWRISVAATKWLQRNIRRFDVVIVEAVFFFPAGIVRRECIRHDIPYIVVSHGSLMRWFKCNAKAKHYRKYLTWFWSERLVLRDASCVVFSSLEEFSRSASTFAMTQLSPATVRFGCPQPEDAGERSSEKSAKRLLFAGRFHSSKGLYGLLEALAEIGDDADWELTIAGAGTSNEQRLLVERSIELGIDQRLVWRGQLTTAETWSAMADSDLTVVPSLTDSFGMVVAESCAVGTPVLATDQVIASRFLIEHSAGLVVGTSVGQIVEGLRSWFAMSSNDRESMSECARVAHAHDMSIEVFASDWEHLIVQYAKV